MAFYVLFFTRVMQDFFFHNTERMKLNFVLFRERSKTMSGFRGTIPLIEGLGILLRINISNRINIQENM